MYNIDEDCAASLLKLNRRIGRHWKKERKKMFDSWYPKRVPIADPSIEVQQEITLTIHDTATFYKCVWWCNNRIGVGTKYWTIKSKVLKYVDPSKSAYNPPATKTWLIFVPGIEVRELLSFTS